MLHCSFSLAAAQLLVKMTSALQKSECCSAVSAAQLSENCSATSLFACGMLQGWGLEGWALGLAEFDSCSTPFGTFRAPGGVLLATLGRRAHMSLVAQRFWQLQGSRRVALANVPVVVPGNIRMYPRSGFRSGRTSAKTTLLEKRPFVNP